LHWTNARVGRSPALTERLATMLLVALSAGVFATWLAPHGKIPPWASVLSTVAPWILAAGISRLSLRETGASSRPMMGFADALPVVALATPLLAWLAMRKPGDA